MGFNERVELLVGHIKGLQDFAFVRPEIPIPYKNMGATIIDGMLQAGIKYETVVKPLVKKFLKTQEAETTNGFYKMINRAGNGNPLNGIKSLINWNDDEKPIRILGVVNYFLDEGIEIEEDLKKWLTNPLNVMRFKELRGVGNKTVDYFKNLCGIPNVAVDRWLIEFLNDAGIKIQIDSYREAKEIIIGAADKMNINRTILDHSIWFYMSGSKRPSPCPSNLQNEKNIIKKSIQHSIKNKKEGCTMVGPYRMNRIVLCSSDAGPNSQRSEPEQAGYFFPGAKWVGTLRNAAKRLHCKFVITTTAYGMVTHDELIEPYDLPASHNVEEVKEKWGETFKEVLGENNYDIALCYLGGCPRNPGLPIKVGIFNSMNISVIKFGRPNMLDIGKIDRVAHLLTQGTSIDEIKSILDYPEYLEFFPALPPEISSITKNIFND
jgi:hypothetical protein